METRPDFICCANMRDVLMDLHVPGSTLERASYCGHLIWMSPEARLFRASKPDAITVCHDCFIADATADCEVVEMPGVRESIRRMGWSEEQMDRTMESVRRYVKTKGKRP